MLETYLRMEALEHFAVSDLCIQGFTVAGTFDQESPKQASEVGNSSWDSWEKETHQNWALWLQVGEGICSFSGSIWIHREVCLFNGFQRFFFMFRASSRNVLDHFNVIPGASLGSVWLSHFKSNVSFSNVFLRVFL